MIKRTIATPQTGESRVGIALQDPCFYLAFIRIKSYVAPALDLQSMRKPTRSVLGETRNLAAPNVDVGSDGS